MILNGTAPKALSPVGRWAVLALGVVLLPLWPTWAHSQVPGDRAISGADRAVVATNAADDEASEEQLHQERATVRELTAELERMRARVETLARRLQEAQARLARLEGRNEPPRVNGVHQGPIHLDNTALPRVNPVVRPHTIGTLPTVKDGQAANVAPMLAALGARADTVGEHQRANPAADLNRSDRHRGGDYDQRLREVEAKIDRLLEELKRLREQQPPRPSEPRRF